MLERALTIDGYTKLSELQFLQEIARSLPPGAIVVEVGSWKGRSTVAICDALDGTNAVVWAVDTFRGDAELVDLHGTIDHEAVRAEFTRNTGEYERLRVLEADSVAAAASFADRSIDWVFIDADHSYDAVLADIAAWAPKVKDGGLISGHDYGRSGVTDAVRRSFGSVSVAHSIWHTREQPRLRVLPALRIATRRLLRGQ